MDMKAEKSLVAFEDHKIRRVYDEKSETWFFSGKGGKRGQSSHLSI